MNSSEPDSLTVTQRYAQPAIRVFDAWLDPAIAGRFLFATDTGQMLRVAIDARVDGAFSFIDRRGDKEVAHVGHYVEIARPHRLVFSFSVPIYSPDSNLVAITIQPDADGSTLQLQCATPPEQRERARQGWQAVLQKLARALA